MSPFYPECAATPEEDGPNFESPLMGPAFQRGQRRLREAEAFSKVQREAREFHERKARKYGVDHPVGMAHFKASRAYVESAGKLQEMFGTEGGQQPDPKAMCKAHKAAIKFHKKSAQKAGLDSPTGQAHVNALQTHLGALNKLKASIAGASGKQSPVPVPKKSDQPNGDIHQNLPPQPIQQLQGKKESMRKRINSFGREAKGPDTKSALPKYPDRKTLQDKTDMFRARKMRPAAYGPKAAKPQIHGGTDQKGGTLDREARRSLRRPIWESDDSERDRSASGLTA